MNTTEIRDLTDAELNQISGGACATTEITIVGTWGKFVMGFSQCKGGDLVVPHASFEPAPQGGKGKGGSPK